MTKKKTKGVALPPKAAELDPKADAAIAALKAKQADDELLIGEYANVVNPKPALACEIFALPDYCSVSSVCMREMDCDDELTAAYWADMNATAEVRDSQSAAQLAERREGARLALVGVDGRQVNVDGVPFSETNSWNSRTWYHIDRIFIAMNGVPESDVKNVQGSAVALRIAHQATASRGANQPEDE